jgi:hypothetical protein
MVAAAIRNKLEVNSVKSMQRVVRGYFSRKNAFRWALKRAEWEAMKMVMKYAAIKVMYYILDVSCLRLNCCICLIGRVYVFYVGHVDKSSVYETLFHCYSKYSSSSSRFRKLSEGIKVVYTTLYSEQKLRSL